MALILYNSSRLLHLPQLSTDIWQEICKHLPIEDIPNVLLLNKYINQIDKYIWEPLLYRDFITCKFLGIEKETYKEEYKYQFKNKIPLNKLMATAMSYNFLLISEGSAVLRYA